MATAGTYTTLLLSVSIISNPNVISHHLYTCHVLQELQQLLKHTKEECTAMGNYKDRFLVLQQQHESLQSVCHQLHQDLGTARDDLVVAHNAGVNPDVKSPKGISLQSNSTILDSCNEDDMHAHNARSQHIPVSQNEHHLGSVRGVTEDGIGQAALQAQQLADRLVDITLQRDILSACPSALLYSLEDTLQHALKNTQRVARETASSELSQMKSMLKQVEQMFEDHKSCPLCMEHDKDMVLNCGHQFCEMCSGTLTECPFCRTAVSMRLKMFSA